VFQYCCFDKSGFRLQINYQPILSTNAVFCSSSRKKIILKSSSSKQIHSQTCVQRPPWQFGFFLFRPCVMMYFLNIHFLWKEKNISKQHLIYILKNLPFLTYCWYWIFSDLYFLTIHLFPLITLIRVLKS